MSLFRRLPLEAVVLLYLLAYLPNVILTKLVTSRPNGGLGRPLTGLETLPSSLIVSLVLTYLFIWFSGWHRAAHHRTIGGLEVPFPTWATFVSGIGTALVLFTVPLSFTFTGVSIPFIQLLMRGDLLIIAPLVDLAFGRRVRWWSWVALLMVASALLLVVRQRGGFNLPPLAIATVVLYTLGYVIRLAVMTKVSKSGSPDSIRRYFVEEKIVALPLSIVFLAMISELGGGNQSSELARGFLLVWSEPVIGTLIAIGVTLTIVSIFAAIILLDARENSYCVPLERSASLLAGIFGALVLAWGWGLPMPTPLEVAAAGILIGAILLLSVAPRFANQVSSAAAKSP